MAVDVAVLYRFANPYRGHTDEVARMARTGQLVVSNSASFKGMERPAVVVGLDLDPTKTHRVDEVRKAIYAAATRARSHLTVVGDPEWPRRREAELTAHPLEEPEDDVRGTGPRGALPDLRSGDW